MAHIRVRGGQYELAKLLKVHHLVHRTIKLLDYSVRIVELRVQELFVHEIVELIASNFAISVNVNHLE